MKPDSDSRLPRPPQNPDNVIRLRQEAIRRLEEEERKAAAPVYGGPPRLPDPPPADGRTPAPVYGGPTMGGGGGSPTRRGTLWALLVAALGIVGAWLYKSGYSPVPVTVYGGPPIPPPQPQPEVAPPSLTGAIVTENGHLLTAAKGGGLGNPDNAPVGVALTTGATTAGQFETFTLVWVDQAANKFALKTSDGHYVTAVNGGGIGGPDTIESPIHTDSTHYGPSETFIITLLPDKIHATIQTYDGSHFLSAVKGGGVGGSNHAPIRTDATTMTPEAVFQLKTEPPAAPEPERRVPAPVYGGPTRHPPG